MSAELPPLEIKLYTDAGQEIVCAAMNMTTGELESFCLPLHKDYPEWKINMEANGRGICQMTVEEVCDVLGGTNEPRH